MRKAYKILRNILFTLVLTVAGIYVMLYVALSLPYVQNEIRDIAVAALNKKTGGEFSIEKVQIYPFNKLILSGVELKDPEGRPVAKAEKIGAGIGIWRLIFEQKIIITFGEIIGLDAHLSQERQGGPTNIQFLIDAFSPKDKTKPPTQFDLQLNNIVLRRCRVSWDRKWQPRLKDTSRIDFNHLSVSDLSADIRIPVMRNDDFEVDLRRLSLKEKCGFDLEGLSGQFIINTKLLAVNDLKITLPGTQITQESLRFPITGFKNIRQDILGNPIHLSLSDTRITPSDFAAFLPALANWKEACRVSLDIVYELDKISIDRLALNMPQGINLHMRGEVKDFGKGMQAMRLNIPELALKANANTLTGFLGDITNLKPDAAAIIRRLGDFTLKASLEGTLENARLKLLADCSLGSATVDAKARKVNNIYDLAGTVTTPGFELGRLLANEDFGRVVADVQAAGRVGKGVLEGQADLSVPLFQFKGYSYSGLTASLSKQATLLSGEMSMLDQNIDFDISGQGDLLGKYPQMNVQGEVRRLNLSPLGLGGKYADLAVSGAFDVDFSGLKPDEIDGYADFTNLNFSNSSLPQIHLDHLRVESHRRELPYSFSLRSDAVDADLEGEFTFAGIYPSLLELAGNFLPSVVPGANHASEQDYHWKVRINHNSPLLALVKMPVTLLEDLEINGLCNTHEGRASLLMDVPYLQQGKDKLIRNTRLALDIDTARNLCALSLGTRFPNKKGDIDLKLRANALNDSIHTNISWLFDRARSYRGDISLTGIIGEKTPEGQPVTMLVNPSTFEVNDTIWHVNRSRLQWDGHRISVDSLLVNQGMQFALIDGVASPSADDYMYVDLSGIDLDYVFETLAINYVTFGGKATGRLQGSALLSSAPILYTDGLNVKALTYNHSLLGDALIKSNFDTRTKAVHIDADIAEKQRHVAKVLGDIYVARDSLSIGIAADSVNVAFLQPFMMAFSSDVEGRASGNVKLFGTFKDIDLVGRVHADSLRMKVDITNVWYSACDSVIIDPGVIHLDNITLRDRDGHTALLNGEVRHRYFHEPTFDFKITKANNLLVYDTNQAMGERWWGTIYGNGSGTIHGVPGYINIVVDMNSAPGSTFTFALDDREEAVDYQFITFTDKRKEAEEARLQETLAPAPEEPEFLKRFRRAAEQQTQGRPTRYDMDLRMRATPDAKVCIIMDPVAGDKIDATGSGALRMTYNSENELNLYGTYTLDQGLYNFTLQDLIVRDFKIRQGSKITFDGDPLAATLNLTAVYKVNTSLTELDKSFATDRELNRTNVPVEALLKVDGDMRSPEITFDLDFPTLSNDVASKVRSIISTSDMMNRQIIYLLALNRFYTPDYMNNDASGGELSSLASTTLSTQLGQMLGTLAPGWSFSPYFRTEKGDFSDMEVDLALSSALFNNRLLLNGNFGYRDKATSNTTFVGDFDIEYLLNRSGTLRLKAYNHFNDQSYYLRSALTTQGLGILYKRDFNRFLPGLFRKKKKQPEKKKPAQTPAPAAPAEPSPILTIRPKQ